MQGTTQRGITHAPKDRIYPRVIAISGSKKVLRTVRFVIGKNILNIEYCNGLVVVIRQGNLIADFELCNDLLVTTTDRCKAKRNWPNCAIAQAAIGQYRHIIGFIHEPLVR